MWNDIEFNFKLTSSRGKKNLFHCSPLNIKRKKGKRPNVDDYHGQKEKGIGEKGLGVGELQEVRQLSPVAYSCLHLSLKRMKAHFEYG